MFPNARYSLRRWSAAPVAAQPNHNSHKKVPIPIGVSLHNVIIIVGAAPSASKQAEGASNTTEAGDLEPATKTWFRRPQHESKLLFRLRLEIIVEEDQDHTKVVYSSLATRPSAEPTWEHLDERLSLPDQWWLDETVYPNMKLRILRCPTTWSSQTEKGQGEAEMDQLFLELPLYPPKLERLYSEEEEESPTIPSALPPNACLVYYSDGSTRLSPELFAVLLKEHLTRPAPMEDFSRFDDTVFSALDHTTAVKQRARAESISALLEAAPMAPAANDNDDILMHIFDNDNGDQDQGKAGDQRQEETLPSGSSTSGPSKPPSFEKSESDAVQLDRQTEKGRLEALIAQEELRWQEEVALLEEDRTALASLLQNANELERQIHQIQQEAQCQKVARDRDVFAQDAQQMKLLRELQTIYPIALDHSRPRGQKDYTIRKLRLPVDVYTTRIPEEELSAALGYSCHLVILFSKYLNIGLKYRLHCHGSRSAIQISAYDASSLLANMTNASIGGNELLDPALASMNNQNLQSNASGATWLPLFAARSVDREQLDRAMNLLGANIDCLLATIGVEFTPHSHLLGRLQRIYDHVVCGEIPLLGASSLEPSALMTTTFASR